MVRYVLLYNQMVIEVLTEYVEDFPGIYITERYPADLLSKAVIVTDDNIEIDQTMSYNPITGEFYKTPEPEPPEIPDIPPIIDPPIVGSDKYTQSEIIDFIECLMEGVGYEADS